MKRLKNFFKSFKNKLNKMPYFSRNRDEVDLNLYGLNIKLKRSLKTDIPHEVSVIVPRAEIRKKCLNEDCSKYEIEIILSSITVVHAPRHPLADPTKPPEIPRK